jgi:hypothetical protein
MIPPICIFGLFWSRLCKETQHYDEKLGLYAYDLDVSPLSRMDSGGIKSGALRMSDPFKSKAFKDEFKLWHKKLEKSGFEDIEDSYGFVSNKFNRRKSNLEDIENVRNWFLTLDSLMTHYPEMPSFDRRVMSLYSSGVRVKDIVKKVKSSKRNVMYCVSRYKHLVLAIIRMTTTAPPAPSLRLISNEVSEVTASAEDRIQNKAA